MMKKLSIMLIGALASAFVANAVPAKRGFFSYQQPDGSVISLQLRGSQHGHYYLTDDNVPVLMDNDGVFRYAFTDKTGNIKLSSVQAQNLVNRSAEGVKAISESSYETFDEAFSLRSSRLATRRGKAPQSGLGTYNNGYPTTGKVHSLVILVEYADEAFHTESPNEYFTRMLNEEGFSDNGGTGSARDYFLHQSNGQFDVTFDVVGPVKLPNNRSYYGANDAYGNDARAEYMVIHAAEILDPDLNFADYDYNNDGIVDNIFVMYAGLGEADGGAPSTVWPHSWELPDPVTHDGKIIKGYACANEWDLDNTPTGIGTVVHEFSHVMGLPDLYVTSGNGGSFTPGSWSILDMGPYNNDGNTPPNFSAYERNAMGWIDPIILDGPETVTLEAIHRSNNACLIPTEKNNEFFLLENRQQEGWDEYIPYHGMLIWHIDYDENIWRRNIVNNSRSHQYVDLEEANNNPNNNNLTTMRGYPFPGTSRKTSFTSTTSPALRTWDNKGIDLPITDITESEDGVISFKVDGGRIDLATPEAPELTADDKANISVTWKPVELATEYLLTVYTKEDGEQKIFGEYDRFNVGDVTTYTIENVLGKTEYFVTVTAAVRRNYSEPSPEASVETPEIDIEYLMPTALSGTNDKGEVTLSWLALPGAEKYLLTIEAEVLGEPEDMTVDFGSETTVTFPEGWVWEGGEKCSYGSSSTGYYGNSVPSLKFSANGETLTSQLFKGLISNVKFWLRGANAQAPNYFNVEGRYDTTDEWSTLYSVNPISAVNAKGTVFEFKPAANTRQIRFIYYKTNNGNAALDDVCVTIPSSEFEAMESHNRLDVGNVLEHTTTIATPTDRIRFFIEAQNAEGRTSKRSNIVTINMNATSGIGNTAVAQASVTVDGSDVLYTGKAGAVVSVVNLAGATVATTVADSEGNASITLPAGFYIVRTPDNASKVVIR